MARRAYLDEKTSENRSLERPFRWEIPDTRYIDDDFMRRLHLTTSDMKSLTLGSRFLTHRTCLRVKENVSCCDRRLHVYYFI